MEPFVTSGKLFTKDVTRRRKGIDKGPACGSEVNTVLRISLIAKILALGFVFPVHFPASLFLPSLHSATLHVVNSNSDLQCMAIG